MFLRDKQTATKDWDKVWTNLGKLPTYPSPKEKLTLTSHLR